MQYPSFVAGVYASQPADDAGREEYYELLSEMPWIHGAELPFPGELLDADKRRWLAHHVPASWHRNNITMIPGTMVNVWADGNFGLASPHEEGRQRAVQHLQSMRAALQDFNDLRGSQDVAYLQIHSAPTKIASLESFQRSLEEVASWDWGTSKLCVEHCDRFLESQKPEKGFLSLSDEIAACQQFGVGVTLNWGRSMVEERDVDRTFDQVRQAVEDDVLVGLMFSGAGPEETQYGYSWIDGHLPMSVDEPTSLLTESEIARCTAEALKSPRVVEQGYIGAKVCVPAETNLLEREAFLEHIYRSMGYVQD